MVEPLSCALCRRRGDAHVEVPPHAFCVVCLSAVGRFLREGPEALVESVWRARPRELARRALSDIVDAEIAKIRQAAPSDHPSLESAITAFKAGLAPGPKPPEAKDSEPVVHLDLAIAYRQMGLTDEALGEAAIALSGAERLGTRAGEAAAIALSPGCLKAGVEQTLVTLRTVLFPG